jgi:hypothetical protein
MGESGFVYQKPVIKTFEFIRKNFEQEATPADITNRKFILVFYTGKPAFGAPTDKIRNLKRVRFI